MTIKEGIKIFFLALIAGSIMGVVIIEIFGTLDLMKLIQLELCVIFIIIFLFIVSKLWNKRLRKISNSNDMEKSNKGKTQKNNSGNNN
jgi:high-affinity Fe2+/Pb2+ permease